jgi:hypothetical protein
MEASGNQLANVWAGLDEALDSVDAAQAQVRERRQKLSHQWDVAIHAGVRIAMAQNKIHFTCKSLSHHDPGKYAVHLQSNM